MYTSDSLAARDGGCQDGEYWGRHGGGEAQGRSVPFQFVEEDVRESRVAFQVDLFIAKDTDPPGPNSFLIRDTHGGSKDATWRLWLTVRRGKGADTGKGMPRLPGAGLDVPSGDGADGLALDGDEPKVKPKLWSALRVRGKTTTMTLGGPGRILMGREELKAAGAATRTVE
ncbi:MAG: hypothetical protein HQ559_04095 [Lentisphaerae bacterium]|nr:hypothetical protein [Lentisphaerota bacterium]